jgi:hypothetical protein
MVDAVSGDSLVFAVAFHHKANHTLSVVLINGNSVARDVSIAGSSLPPQFRRYLTSAADNCADKGLVSSGAAITLPASSVTTLYGESYAPTVGVAEWSRVGQARGRTSATDPRAAAFTLRGERVSASRRAAGVVMQRMIFSDGAAVVSPLVSAR